MLKSSRTLAVVRLPSKLPNTTCGATTSTGIGVAAVAPAAVASICVEPTSTPVIGTAAWLSPAGIVTVAGTLQIVSATQRKFTVTASAPPVTTPLTSRCTLSSHA